MRKLNGYLLPCILTVLVAAGCTPGTGGAAVTAPLAQNSAATTSAEIRFKVPEGWITEKPSSSMRVAQYKLPKVEGDSADASLVLYFFGSGQGGTISDNIDRWINQIKQTDGSSSKEKAKTEKLTVNGLQVTTVDVSGTYTAEMAPGSQERHNDANQRLRGAVIETPKGNYYLKLIGPAKTVSHWDDSVTSYIKSIEFK
ncbi:MAG TPA: hypothetical protein VN643_07210 [Pyrinomonadaceae bacterium]|nr:hypothetical protein [Pyrinomonadaceae bacterium]